MKRLNRRDFLKLVGKAAVVTAVAVAAPALIVKAARAAPGPGLDAISTHTDAIPELATQEEVSPSGYFKHYDEQLVIGDIIKIEGEVDYIVRNVSTSKIIATVSPRWQVVQ